MSLVQFVEETKLPAADLNANFSSVLGTVIFGDGADGDINFDGSTNYASFSSRSGSVYTLTRDCYFNNITIATGVEVKPNGWKVFVRGTTTFVGTGKFSAYGGNGSNGASPANGNGSESTGGAGGAVANTVGSLPASLAGSRGADGSKNAAGEVQAVAGVATVKGINANNASASGSGGTGETNETQSAGAAGANSGVIKNLWRTIYDFIYLRDMADDMAALKITPSPGGGGGGGHAGADTVYASDYYSGGAGGGSGATGGIVWLFSRYIITVNGNHYIDVHGGNGGNGGNAPQTQFSSATQRPAGGGGGGAGGNGGVAIVVYETLTGTGTINLAGGTKGIGGLRMTQLGAGPAAANGSDGADGVTGVSKILQINL